MSQIILIFVKLNNKQRFINGLTHYNETQVNSSSESCDYCDGEEM